MITGAAARVNTPVAVFCYNRPRHLNLALEALSRCPEIAECALYIICDGQKASDGSDAVPRTRAVAGAWAERLGGRLIEREINYGVRRSIYEGITDLCSRYGRIVVVEDDIVVSPSFLSYTLAALDRFADSPRVFQVSGYMFPVKVHSPCATLFLPFSCSWGWATWERAWRQYDGNTEQAVRALRRPRTRRAFDLGGRYPFTEMLRMQHMGQIDTWDIQWYWTVFKARGLVLYPSTSLARNIGFDGSGTHYTQAIQLLQATEGAVKRAFYAPGEAFPRRVEIDRDSYQTVARFLERQAQQPRFRALRTVVAWLIITGRSAGAQLGREVKQTISKVRGHDAAR